jgi:predicted GH43/DUF377 family glycosyl hydrolase
MKNVVMCILVLMIATATFGQGEPGMGQIWAKNPENPTFTIGGEQGSWHTGEVPGDYFNTCLVWDGTQYRLYFTGINEAGVRAIGYCTSDNPYEGWVEYENNPVFTAEDMDWGTIQVCSPYVIWDGSLFRMWFIGEDLTGHGQVGFASSVDGNTWTSHAAPVLSTNSAHTWENLHIGINIVLMENDSTYFMYYSAQGIGEGYSIGCATSSDGIAWTKMFDEPIIGHDQWHTFWVVASHVQKFGDTYVMWYAGSNSGIIGDPGKVGVATSADGINWHRDELFNPVMPDGPDGSWDDAMLSVISVLPYEDHYRALFCGVSTDIDSLRFGWADYTPTVIPAGDVSGTWTKAGSPIRVQGEITVPDGATLTIEAGTTVEFLGHHSLNVQGQILAIGTEEDPIRFWVDDTLGFADDAGSEGVWQGFRFEETPASNDSSRLSQCDIAYAKKFTGNATALGGDAGGGIKITGFSKLRIDHCRIHHNACIANYATPFAVGGGISIAYGASPDIQWNIIEYNRVRHLLSEVGAVSAGISIVEGSHPLVQGNIIRSNSATETGGGLGAWLNCEPIIVNNLITDNICLGGNDGGAGGGVAFGYDARPILINNTIVNNQAGWVGGGMFVREADAVIINTIIANNTDLSLYNLLGHNAVTLHMFGHALDFHNSCLEGGPDAIARYGSEGTTIFDTQTCTPSDPQLHPDHTLSAGSPCLGTGTPSCEIDGETYNAPSCDCGNNPRPQPAGSHPDMGAFEHYLSGPETGEWEWVRHPDNPLLAYGPDGSWDDYSIALGSVLFLDGTYHMWYSASDQLPMDTDDIKIGYASSADGLHWDKYEYNPILAPEPGSWDAAYVEYPTVCYDGELFHMFYGASATDYGTESIGYATSSDGITWERYGENPVMSPVQTWEGDNLWPTHVEYVGVPPSGWFRMYYVGGYRIGLAYSLDGIEWVRQNNGQPILDKGSFGEWDHEALWDASVLRHQSGGFEMWYTGSQPWDLHLGHATSTNGITWTKDTLNPILTDDWQSFDMAWQAGPCVLETQPDYYEMWFCGSQTPTSHYRFQIGYASRQPAFVGIAENPQFSMPKEFSLGRNFPNPFNPSTTISYELPAASHVTLTIYDITGRTVTTLEETHQPAGIYSVQWNGTNDSGYPVSTGVYLCRLQAGDFSKTIKMVLLR